jgi:predicted P-loop ATPase
MSIDVIDLTQHRKILIAEKQRTLQKRLDDLINLKTDDLDSLLVEEKKIKIIENQLKNQETNFNFSEMAESDGKLKPLLTKPNIEILLDINKMKIYFHEIKKEIFIETLDGEVLYQKEINSFLEDELNRHDFKSKKFEILLRKLEAIALAKKVNPVKDFILESYEKNKDNINVANLELDRLFLTIKGEEDEKNVNYILFKTWMLSLVGSQFNYEFRSQGALTFTGKQGVGKSTWFKNCVPPSLRPYYKEEFALNTIDKDNYIESVKYWLVELSEVGRTIKDSDRAKSHITKQYDEYRAPYERSASKHKRNTVYGSTVDQETFLADDVNRRWWAIKIVDRFDLIDINYELLYAELYYFYLKNPDKCHELDWQEIKMLNEHNKQFNISNETDSLILNIFDWESTGRYYVSANDIGSIINKERISNHKIGKSLKKLEVSYKIFNKKTNQKFYEIPMPRKIRKYETELFYQQTYEKVITENNYIEEEREGIKGES